MNVLSEWFQNTFLNNKRYKAHRDAVIISCFYNPEGNPYRLIAFQKWYNSIKHLPHRIIECLIGPNAKSQLPKSASITQITTDSLLWHKESLLNKIIADLPPYFKYVFWLDADVLFTNQNWLVESVNELKERAAIVQPFEYCVHLQRNKLTPHFNIEIERKAATNANLRHQDLWRSFAANCNLSPRVLAVSENYDVHGHVGFAWGARREVLDQCPLYDRALIGGADHIIAHAAMGQIPHSCIRKGFADNIKEVELWSRLFYKAVKGQVSYANGDLYHIWHGDLSARQYLKRVMEFTPMMPGRDDRDENGLHRAKDKNEYMKRYYRDRECTDSSGFEGMDAGFAEDMGYALVDLIYAFGQSTYSDPVDSGPVQSTTSEPLVLPMTTVGSFDPAPAPLMGFPDSSPGIQHEVAPAPREVGGDLGNFS
jgi:hypothetical protein